MRNVQDMEDIQRTGVWESDNKRRKNYTVKGVLIAMVKKAEENKGRTQFWATIILTLSLAFVPWLRDEFIEKGKTQARQEFFEQEKKALQEKITALTEENKALKTEKVNTTVEEVEPSAQKAKRIRPRRPRINGKADTELLADPSSLRGAPLFSTMRLPSIP